MQRSLLVIVVGALLLVSSPASEAAGPGFCVSFCQLKWLQCLDHYGNLGQALAICEAEKGMCLNGCHSHILLFGAAKGEDGTWALDRFLSDVADHARPQVSPGPGVGASHSPAAHTFALAPDVLTMLPRTRLPRVRKKP